MIRSPAVANQFYPGNSAELTRILAQLVPTVPENKKQKALAVVSPHAGYIYSGGIAGETFSKISIPKDIIILGPNHHGSGSMVAIMAQGEWDMPMGVVPINSKLADTILNHSDMIEDDADAHRLEHSLEVQVPFLQYLKEDTTITPLVISHISYSECEKVGKQLALSIKEYDDPVLIVASSDMTHYESREAASSKDKQAIDHVLALDPQGLYETVLGKGITMCGIMPTTVALVAALELGAETAELVRYTDSGEASGDTRQVVGYAGLIVS